MYFQSSRGIRVRKWLLAFCCLGMPFGLASGQTPDTVVASVNDVEITQKQVDDSVSARIYPLQQQLYAIRKAALENLVVSKILESEAKTRGVSVEELRRQLTLGEIVVTGAQVEQAYTQNASFFAAMSPDEARERLRLDLENQERMKHYRAALDVLRKKWAVRMNFAPPAFVSELDDGVSPAKGARNAAVTIVEFSDFECPYCKAVQRTLKDVLERYRDEVRLVFKHLPLEGHRNSMPAARAAHCACEQERFWQFHDALFGAKELSPAVFTQIANELGLGLPKFQQCLNAEQSRAAIVKDLETSRLLSIESTPSFVINGKLIQGALSFADFQKIIEQELSAAGKQSSTN